jgi:hypothetical protein
MAVTEKQIKELEDFFMKAKLLVSVQLDVGSKVENVSKFIDSHLKVLRNNADKPMYEVFYLRLVKLQEFMK